MLTNKINTQYQTLQDFIITKISSQKHPYHILTPSCFPTTTGTSIGGFLAIMALTMHGYNFFGRQFLFHASGILFVMIVLCGFGSIILESKQGYHTRLVQQGLRMGMVLFIASEVMFFFAFFWSFFHYTLSPSVNIGTVGPPAGTQDLDIGHLPLGNTILLLLSGVTITAAHAYLLEGQKSRFVNMLAGTIALGFIFLICQGFEYRYGVNFSGRDSVQGSIFFITTGFHGLHVTIGTIFLGVCFLRTLVANTSIEASFYDFTPDQHFGFEAAAGYGHFVDVVGLFLFITIYGGGMNS